MVGGLGAVAYWVGKLAIRGDSAVEERRKRAIQLATWTGNNGLPELSQLLVNYASGDYSALFGQVRTLSDTLADSEASKAIVDKFLKVQLDKQLSTPDGREELVKYIEESLNVVIPRDAIKPVAAELKVSDVKEN